MPAIRPTIRLIYQVARVVSQVTALSLDVDDLLQGRVFSAFSNLGRRKPRPEAPKAQQHYAIRRGVPVNRPNKPMSRR